MARTPIHPGEILADELKEIGISGAQPARTLRVPANRISQIVAGKRYSKLSHYHLCRHRLAPGPLLWNQSRSLNESTENLRTRPCPPAARQGHQPHSPEDRGYSGFRPSGSPPGLNTRYNSPRRCLALTWGFPPSDVGANSVQVVASGLQGLFGIVLRNESSIIVQRQISLSSKAVKHRNQTCVFFVNPC